MTKAKRGGQAVAIIGMSGRFPGAPDVHRFWENLRDGVEFIVSFSPEELAAAKVDPGVLQDPQFVPAGSVIDGVELFDAAFFGFSPREAESLDPQQRIFLETAWHALEDAGYDPESWPGSIGVYAGCAMSTYLAYLQSNPAFMALLGYLQVYIGNDKDYLATRVSYKLNLRGPSFSIQTACSTSLLAAAVACNDLVEGRCDMALAGGISVRVPQKTGYYFEAGGIFSPDGHCRVFDERAQGVVFGNGVGVVVLKRVDDAIADGDSIHAVIRGWAVNNDGSAKSSFTAPEHRGAGGGHRAGAEACRRRPEHDHVHRGARNRHLAGRPDRDRCADQGVSRPHEAQGILRSRLCEDQHRAPGSCRGLGEPDQDGACAAASTDPAKPELRGSEPGDRLRGQPILRQHAPRRLAIGP